MRLTAERRAIALVVAIIIAAIAAPIVWAIWCDERTADVYEKSGFHRDQSVAGGWAP